MRTMTIVNGRQQIWKASRLRLVKTTIPWPMTGVDIATMVEANAVDLETAAARLAGLLGDDARVERLRGLAGE